MQHTLIDVHYFFDHFHVPFGAVSHGGIAVGQQQLDRDYQPAMLGAWMDGERWG
jgi:hypothetical protein